ncbi:MAG: Rrf2 family transcriptional regulator [Deltaproteobacteria bacterium]|jgi:Rrf2 family protein|nr:Rrf2 family transcriptional regulator [Deltaproteobacteria bacterium]
MKLSTRSRYGTRMILDMAQHHNGEPVQLGDIARRQNVSLKYLEQIIRPLKEANYIRSYRGSKGGHLLNKAPEEITVGEIVALLEGGTSLTRCAENPETCERVDSCVTRYLWVEASKAIFNRLSKITFADLMAIEKNECKDQFLDFISSQEDNADNSDNGGHP